MRNVTISGVLFLCALIVAATAFAATHEELTTQYLGELTGGTILSRTQAFYDLWNHVDATDLPELQMRLANEPNIEIRWGAARLLGRVSDENSVAPLIQALSNDTDGEVSWASAHSLNLVVLNGVGGASEAQALQAFVDGLNTLPNNPHRDARIRCAASLVDIQGVTAQATLEAALLAEAAGDNDDELTRYLEWAIFFVQQGADTFLPELTPGTKNLGARNGTGYKVYVPTTIRADVAPWPQLLVMIHGTQTVFEQYVDTAEYFAERFGVVVISPYFDISDWPNYSNLNIVRLSIALERSDLRLLEIIDDVGTALGINTAKFYIFGHSQGGQFVQRFAYAHPERVFRMSPAGSGSYLQPLSATAFPFGMTPNPFAQDLAQNTFEDFAAIPCGVVIGTADEPGRITLAGEFMADVEAHALQEGYTHHIVRMDVVDGVHLGRSAWHAGATFLFAHSADYEGGRPDWHFTLTELLRVIQFFNTANISCNAGTEDYYDPNPGDTTCPPHTADYAGPSSTQNWRVSLTELLRMISFYNQNGAYYHICADDGDEGDGYCSGLPPNDYLAP